MSITRTTLCNIGYSCSSRFRRNDEYTSITDSISVVEPSLSADLSILRPIVSDSQITTLAHEEEESREQFMNKTGNTLKCANPTFILKQNEMLREFEEVSER